jgi:hypothetical protein
MQRDVGRFNNADKDQRSAFAPLFRANAVALNAMISSPVVAVEARERYETLLEAHPCRRLLGRLPAGLVDDLARRVDTVAPAAPGGAVPAAAESEDLEGDDSPPPGGNGSIRPLRHTFLCCCSRLLRGCSLPFAFFSFLLLYF